MDKIGLIAGSGTLPLEFLKKARERGESVVVFALEGMASRKIEEAAEKVYWVNIGQYKRYIFVLFKERIRRLVFLGKVEKNVIYDKESYDEEGEVILKNMLDKKDSTIFDEITKRLRVLGIGVVKGTDYLSHLLPEKGVLSRREPDERIKADILFGFNVAKKLAGLDVGQTVIVKGKTVVAIEAMEGTDATIARARSIAGEGCVMVKVSRPDQDMRWDVPTVGSDTMSKLIENEFSALAIESGKVYLLEKEKLIEMADQKNIAVEAI
jgi:DUF1009 family protein